MRKQHKQNLLNLKNTMKWCVLTNTYPSISPRRCHRILEALENLYPTKIQAKFKKVKITDLRK